MGCCADDKEAGHTGMQRFMRALLFLCLISGLLLSAASTGSCRYVRWVSDTELPHVENTNITVNSDFTAGLFRWDPDGAGCRRFPENVNGLFNDFSLGQAFGLLALILALAGMSVMWIELVCCRFCGARMIVSVCFVLAVVSQGCTFVIFDSNLCTSGGPNVAYPCGIDQGGYFAIAAMAILLLCAFLICATPKPEPFCKANKENEVNDPCVRCCACCRKPKPEGEEVAEEEDEEKPSFCLCFPCRKKQTEEEGQVAATGGDNVAEATMVQEEPYPVAVAQQAGSSHSQTYAELPPYREVTFIDNEAFFDTDIDNSTSSKNFMWGMSDSSDLKSSGN